MNARERYYHETHEFRFMLRQIAIAEEFNRQRALRRLALKEAHKRFKLGIRKVIDANVAYYNRQVRRELGL